MTSREIPLLDGAVILRPDDQDKFDELLLMDGKECLVHAEMMSDKTLWIGFYPKGRRERVCMWITAKGGKLVVRAEED